LSVRPPATPPAPPLSLHDALPISSTSSAPTAARDTTPAATPSPVSRSATTVRRLDLVTPLVVSVLPAHRRFAVLDSSAMTMQSSDRKSTRLNSSHVKISYAVFCLK